MSQQDFSERLARLNTKAPQIETRDPAPRPPKRRWPIWAGIIGLACVAAVMFSVGGSDTKPAPSFDETFTGTSASVFDGAFTSYAYPDHGFEIGIPAEWREMTYEEVQAAGGTFADVGDSFNIDDFTNVPEGAPLNFRFNIFTERTQVSDALVHVSQFQSLMSDSGTARMVQKFLDVEYLFLTEPKRVDHESLSVAETVSLQRGPNFQVASLYRAYIVGSDVIVILVTWEDTGIHPSAFAPVLDSLREM